MWSDRVKSPDINPTELLFIRLCPIRAPKNKGMCTAKSGSKYSHFNIVVIFWFGPFKPLAHLRGMVKVWVS